MPKPSALAVASIALWTLGCASSREAFRVRYADIAAGGMQDYSGAAPLVVEFEKGDRLPVDFSFAGEDFELVPSKPKFEIVAKRHCFVRFGGDGIRVSTDGRHFDEKPKAPGSFHVGFSAKRGEPTKLEVAIVAPKRE